MDQIKCLIENCEKPALSRGLCLNCYEKAKRRVQKGIISWKDLEEKGLSLESKKGKNSPFNEAMKKAGIQE